MLHRSVFILITYLYLELIFAYSYRDLFINSNTADREIAVSKLISRLLVPGKGQSFHIKIEGLNNSERTDSFWLKKLNDKSIQISGSTACSVAYGFHYYLKYYCDCHISWDSDQLNLPDVLPDVDIKIQSSSLVRYYQNVCTSSYSFTWWDWSRWEREIDWMALNGINFPLAFIGQEIIWKRVYKKFNLTDEDINEHFAGPAFLSWNRMGNIRKWGGPLSDGWLEKSLNLQHLIINRMRELGIVPILPCFAGHVPKAFKRLYPNASLTPLTKWANFSDQYCCPFIVDPVDPLFKNIGSIFMQELISEFGTNHVYQCDMFNEMVPKITDDAYLRNVSNAVFQTMVNTDPNAIWVLQGWIFVDEATFWTKEKAQALLSGVPDDKMIILDLQSDFLPQYTRLNSYFGKPFIWCMLHNFGGTLGMQGSADIINNRVHEARNMPNSTMIGIGLTPEGINQNYVMYDLMLETAWHSAPVDLNQWFSNYSDRRYGVHDDYLRNAWNLLRKSVYNFKWLLKLRGQYTICVRPKLNINPRSWYDIKDLVNSWNNFIIASKNNSKLYSNILFKYDLTDVTRQVLQLYFDNVYENGLIPSYRNHNLNKFDEWSEIIKQILLDMERILSTDKHFMIGLWISMARSAGSSESEKDLFEYNARNQITLWGPNGEILDYATKQWSGIVADYYYPRWFLFLSYLRKSIVNEIPFNHTEFNENVFFTVEQPFTFSKKNYPIVPTENTIAVANSIYERWRNKTILLNIAPNLDHNYYFIVTILSVYLTVAGIL